MKAIPQTFGNFPVHSFYQKNRTLLQQSIIDTYYRQSKTRIKQVKNSASKLGLNAPLPLLKNYPYHSHTRCTLLINPLI